MNGFLVAAAVTVLVVLVVLMRPFFRRIVPSATSRKELNSAIYREQFAKLEQDLAEGMIAKDDYAQARAELQRRLLEEVQVEDAAVTVNPPRKTMLGIALAVPLVAGAFYLLIGNPGSLTASAGHQMADAKELERMVEVLAQKLEKEPNNPQGWAMLARSYKVMGRTAEAEKAFERAGPFIDDDAQALASYADVVATNAGGSLAGKPTMLIQKALKADPDNPMALWLSGTADLEAGNYRQALQTWERLAAMLPPGSDDARMLQGAIDDVRAKSGIVAKLAPALRPGQGRCRRQRRQGQRHRGTRSGAQGQGRARRCPDDRRPPARHPDAAGRGAVARVGAAGEIHARRFAIDESAIAAVRRRRGGGGGAHFEDRHGQARARRPAFGRKDRQGGHQRRCAAGGPGHGL